LHSAPKPGAATTIYPHRKPNTMSLTNVATHASRLHALLTDNAVQMKVQSHEVALEIWQAFNNLGAALDALNTGAPAATIATTEETQP
jgi:hypothetical protein